MARHEPPDPELVAAAQRGEAGALDRLLERHADRVHAVCRRILGRDEDALDATQEALLSIARALPRFDQRAAFTTWIHRIATNAALDEARRRGRRPQPVETLALETLAEPADPGSEADRVTDRLDLDEALGRLPEDFRAAVVLRDVAGLDYAEIAAVLDIAPGTVRSRIARGRRALAADLGNRGHGPRRPTEEPTGLEPTTPEATEQP